MTEPKFDLEDKIDKYILTLVKQRESMLSLVDSIPSERDGYRKGLSAAYGDVASDLAMILAHQN